MVDKVQKAEVRTPFNIAERNGSELYMIEKKVVVRHALFDWFVAAFSACEAQLVNVPVLQPADPFLDIAGEDLRRRIFMTENENGDSLCLRPEFTIPVCLDHLKNEVTRPCRYGYVGEVYRQRREGPSAFYQAGIEDIGHEDQATADARSLFDALTLLDEVKAPFAREILLGDHSVFEAVLAALGLPKGWQLQFLRCFGDDTQLRALMQRLAAPVKEKPLPPALQGFVERGDEAGLVASLEEEMFAANISPAAGRTPKEIAHRLIEKYALAHISMDQKALATLEAFLAIDVPLSKAEKILNEFAKNNNLELGNVIRQFSARNEALQQFGIDLLSVRYDAAFGRPIDYYTGLVYEVRQGEKLIVGGGRYDRLLSMLGAKKPVPAVGFSIWLDRLEGEGK